MSVQVLHGRDASVTRVSVVEVVQPLALLPVPETTANIHTHTFIYRDLWFDLFYIKNHHVWNSQGSCVLWPDAVLVGYGDAGVEGVELHNRRHSRVSVDEYLIIQTGNTCIGVKKCKKEENFFKLLNRFYSFDFGMYRACNCTYCFQEIATALKHTKKLSQSSRLDSWFYWVKSLIIFLKQLVFSNWTRNISAVD